MRSTQILLSDHATIDRDSSLPFYQQLKDILVDAMREETLLPGDRLPSERELRDAFGVSRLTVRRAITDLIHAGTLFTQAGKGTYVRAPKLAQAAQQLSGLSEDMKSRGHLVTSRVLQVAVQPATGKSGKTMGLAPADSVVLVERLRFVDDEPLSIERCYLNHRLCPGIELLDLTGSLYGILLHRYGLAIPRAQQSYEAVAAGRREAGLLAVAEGAPLLFSERVAYVPSGEVIEHGVAWYRGDRYRFFTMLMGPDAGAATADGDLLSSSAPISAVVVRR